jgi:hypothetical protein
VLVADYQPDERQIALAIGYGVPSEQIAFETEKWRDYHAAKGDVVKDAPASWRTWMRNAVTYAAKDRASPNGQYKNNAEKTQDVIRRYAEMIERNEKNGTAEDHEQSPTVRAHIAHRSVPLDDG